MLSFFFFFFFKQKTAYEMRISDWSSDVCSSDLEHEPENESETNDRSPRRADLSRHPGGSGGERAGRCRARADRRAPVRQPAARQRRRRDGGAVLPALLGVPLHRPPGRAAARCRTARRGAARQGRSEEHTSELQSLMRISYA